MSESGNPFRKMEPRADLSGLTFKINVPVDKYAVNALYENAGLNRPRDPDRIGEMYKNSNLVVSAWDGDKLVGVARSLTDFFYCCYCSDLAVLKDYQVGGIGTELLRITKETIGDKCMLLLMSAPTAMEYYPKIGMKNIPNGFIVDRIV